MKLPSGPIARGTIRTSAVLGLRLVVQAGTLLLVARMLGPQHYGAFAGIAALAVVLGTLSTFGMHMVLLGEMSRNPSRRAHVLARALPVTMICAILLMVVFLSICLVGLREAEVPLRVLIAIGITETLLQPLLGLHTSELLSQGHVARSQMLTTLPLVLRLAAATGVFWAAPTAPLADYGYACLGASLAALIVASTMMPGRWPSPAEWCWPDRYAWREAAGYAALNVTAAGPAELDKTLATRLLPLADSGVYAAGQRVAGAITLPVVAMMLSAMPRLFREGRDQQRRTIRLLRWMFAATIGYSFALSCVLWLCAPAIASIFGREYVGVERMLHWLIPAIPGMALRTAAGSVLMALGKPWVRVGFEAIGLAALTVASVSLTARLGPIGMPLGLACAEWTMALLGGWLVMRACR